MTCIIGCIDKKFNRVVMGADSASSDGSSIFIRKDPKIFKNKDFIIGATSSYRMIQLLRFSFIPPAMGDKDIYEYMVTDFVTELRKCFSENGVLWKDGDGQEYGGVFLVGYEDRLFKIDSYFQVAENVDGIAACGCGANFALGAMLAIKDNKATVEKKIERALEVSEHFSVGVQRPFIILNT